VATARKTSALDHVEPALVAQVEAAIRSAGAIPLNKLSRVKLTPEAQATLERELVARGLERAPRAMRVPVDEQILALVQGGGRVQRKDVARRVKGAAWTEITAALPRLCRAGSVRIVVRTQVEVLVGGADRVLDAAEIGALFRAQAELGKVLKKVRAKGLPRSLLREDLAALLGPLAAAAPAGARDARAPAPHEDARKLVAAALRRLEHPSLKLVRIPELVRSLAGQLAVADVHGAIEDAAAAGAIELRPEAGGEFLSDDDARLCPPGPRGTVFSYARLLPS
jgi:hypothetical protein